MVFNTVRASDDPTRPRATDWKTYTTWLAHEWGKLLSSNCSEVDAQRFLEAHPCLLPGAADDVGAGHHGPVLWSVISLPELQGLGRRRIPDFMWVRRDTANVRPICIEIESPSKPWFSPGTQTPTAKLTEALDQLVEWKVWFSQPDNQSVFLKTYAPEFNRRVLEPQYVLIYGRDAEFRSGTSPHPDHDYMRSKRDHMRRSNESFYTFDMLKPAQDAEGYVTLTRKDNSWILKGLPPTFTTHPVMSDLFRAVSNPESALQTVPLISDERRAYVASRWRHWRSDRQQDQTEEFTVVSLGGGE
ncbi:Shedu anti-phage system protein SduA domain-containing protein [Streptomyces sp. NPDC005775]|uniref:Shedu anti-phage system protein SduA domain-containing protein n=1 Tax=Streptomyces sp. NPDC005775 TaxID=3364729 RepID=UPI00368CB786